MQMRIRGTEGVVRHTDAMQCNADLIYLLLSLH